MLDRHADSRGLRRKEAAAAGGVLRFYREGAAAQEIVLPQGLVASTAGAEPVRFVTTAEGRIAAGETEALVPAQAEQPGSTGNAAAGSITVLVTAVGSVDGVENPEGFSGGQDAETDDELRSRLLEQAEQAQNDSIAADRRRQVGSGDRSGRIRTYNFPQNRVSDHRIELTLYRLDAVMNGDLDLLIEPLLAHEQAEKLQNREYPEL